MHAFSRYIAPDGGLAEGQIVRRISLYQGMNGSFVERFYVENGQSYIYKPVTHQGQEEKEIWVYKHVLPKVVKVYPALLAHSEQGQPGWAIYEDLGELSHTHRPATLLRMSRLIADWHRLSTEDWGQAPLTAPKPPIGQMTMELIERKAEAGLLLQEAGIPAELILHGAEWVNRSGFVQEMVLNHGDLHAGNFAVSQGQLYVLDWEHAHLNSPLWDLYHLLDMTHPVYPRHYPVTMELRTRVLRGYVQKSREYGRELDEQHFTDDYYAYAFLFSLWMLLLIEGDLKKGSLSWSRPQLLRQRTEAVDSLKDCGLRFWQANGGGTAFHFAEGG